MYSSTIPPAFCVLCSGSCVNGHPVRSLPSARHDIHRYQRVDEPLPPSECVPACTVCVCFCLPNAIVSVFPCNFCLKKGNERQPLLKCSRSSMNDGHVGCYQPPAATLYYYFFLIVMTLRLIRQLSFGFLQNRYNQPIV